MSPEFEPWNLLAVPLVWALIGVLTFRDYISSRLRSKP